MKKLLTFVLTLTLILSLSACVRTPTKNNNINNEVTITREKALEIALQTAGLNENDIRDLEIELDNERTVTVWEVDFDYKNLEYSYDINAQTGAITKAERERD